MSQPASFYEAVGGEETFRRLVHRFYQGVATDPVLRPVYPAQDLGPAEEHLRLFLMQYWGGPQTYNELRGHPRLRMRHVRFAIGEAERDAWLHHMREALDELGLDEAHDAQLWDYLVMAAHSLVNVEPAHGHGDLGLTPALASRGPALGLVRSDQAGAKPLLITHGFPSSVAAHTLYEQAHSSDWGPPPAVPQGFAVFGADQTVRTLVPAPPGAHWTEFTRGQHFPAMEAPADLAADLRAFFAPLE